MMRILRMIVSVILVLIIVIEVGVYTYKAFEPDPLTAVTTVGEVVYVTTCWVGVEGWEGYRVYIRPLGKGNNEELILFNINSATVTESPFTMDIEKMPELAVGAKVELTHTYKMIRYNERDPDDDRSTYIRGYETYAIRRTEENFTKEQSLLKREDGYWFVKDFGYSDGEVLTVLYVAKVKSPMQGYIVYCIDESQKNMHIQAFWIDLGTSMSKKMEKKLESRETGYKVVLSRYMHDYAFDNLDAQVCKYISTLDEVDRTKLPEEMVKFGENYRIYTFNYYNGSQSSRIEIEDYDLSEIYYYVKIESGEIRVAYDTIATLGRNLICSADADDGAMKGSVRNYLTTDIFLDIDCVSGPVCGTLIISFVPLDEVDYDFER